jgi:NAD+ synthase (glutamine-hydrolysing)
MRLALAQINPTVGDIDGNVALIERFTRDARTGGADLVVFPELALCGYPPKDLLFQEGFVPTCVATAKRLGESCSQGLTLIFGCPLPADQSPGITAAGIANSLLVYSDGRHVDYYDKRLLPTYDVFDEDRYFVPGERAVVLDIAGIRVGLAICEDLWRGEDVGFSSRYSSRPDPVTELVLPSLITGRGGAQLIISPSASPFLLGKGRRHRDILRSHAARHRVFVASVNQCGGNDELIFDGHAAVFAPGGSLIAAGQGFTEELVFCDIDPAAPTATPLASGDPLISAGDEELVFRALVIGIRDYCRKTGFKSAVLGLSGGIDSAVCAVLAAAALGPENIHGVSLPSRYSSQGSRDDAADLASRLGIPYQTIPIEPTFTAYQSALADSFASLPPDVTEENIQSRIRGTILMALSNKFGHLLLTTGNKSELAVGYCTLYGDMNGGLAVLSDLSKNWVYRLARWINQNADRFASLGALVTFPAGSRGPIPQPSIDKPPSAELRPNQTDQDSLPPYDVLDEIIERYVERHQSQPRIVEEAGLDPALVARIVRLINLSEFKRKQAAIGLKVRGVAFGSGRRWPIAHRYRG